MSIALGMQHALHMHPTCTPHAPHMHHTCTAHTSHMHHTCTTHAPHMHCTCTTLSSVTCPTLQYFFTLSQKWHDFLKKVIEHKMCVLISCSTFFLNISHSKKTCMRYDLKCILVFMYSTVMYIGLHVQYHYYC